MKTILSALAIAAASTALAVTSSNTFGILRVDSTAAQTIVSVPWENAGGGAIKVKDVVKTANLTPASETYIGDQLYYYANGTYKMWRLGANGWEGAVTQKVEADGTTVTAEAGSDSDVLVRGGALILIRQNSTPPFYLYGQYTSEEASVACVANGHTLLASPLPAATDLNACTWTGTIAPGDRIVVPSATFPVMLQYNAETKKWGVKLGTGAFSTTKATIPAGQGVWYVSAGGAPTVKFQ